MLHLTSIAPFWDIIPQPVNVSSGEMWFFITRQSLWNFLPREKHLINFDKVNGRLLKAAFCTAKCMQYRHPLFEKHHNRLCSKSMTCTIPGVQARSLAPNNKYTAHTITALILYLEQNQLFFRPSIMTPVFVLHHRLVITVDFKKRSSVVVNDHGSDGGKVLARIVHRKYISRDRHLVIEYSFGM